MELEEWLSKQTYIDEHIVEFAKRHNNFTDNTSKKKTKTVSVTDLNDINTNLPLYEILKTFPVLFQSDLSRPLRTLTPDEYKHTYKVTFCASAVNANMKSKHEN